MYVLGRRAYLYGDWGSVVGEPVVRLIKPAIGLIGRAFVVQGEHRKCLLYRIFTTDGLQRIAPTRQLGQVYRRVGLSRQPLTVIDMIFRCPINIIACSIAQLESHLAALVSTYLLRNVDAESSLTIAQRQRHLPLMSLACLVCHVGYTGKTIEHRRVRLRQVHRHPHHESAVTCCGGLALANAFIIAIYPPPTAGTTDYAVFHLSLLHRHAGIGAGCALDGNGVAVLVVGSHLLELHLKGRTFILLYTESATAIEGANDKTARQSTGRQRKISSTRTVAVGSHFLLGHLLRVRIAQGERQPLAFLSFLLETVFHLVDDAGHMYRLSWTVDGTVGKQVRPLYPAFTVVIAEAVIAAHRPASLVRCRISVNGGWALFVVFIHGFTLGVSSQRGNLLVAAPVNVASQLDGCSLHRLSLFSIDHHVAHLVVGQRLSQGAQVADEVKLSRRLGSWCALHFYHVDANGQSGNLEAVAKPFVLLVSAVMPCHPQFRQFRQQRLQLLVVFFVLRIQVCVAACLDTIDAHCQLADVLEVYRLAFAAHLLSHSRQSHLGIDADLELLTGLFLLRIAQYVHALIAAPAGQRLL